MKNVKNLEGLIKGCIKNNNADQKEFYKKFYPRLMSVSLRVAQDRETAKDLLHDSFIKIFQKLKTLKGYDEAVVYCWCKSIVINTVIDYLRKPARNIRGIELDGNDEYGNLNYGNDLEAKDDDASLLHYKNLEPKDIMNAIESLPPAYKAVFTLIVEGYSHKEVADKLGIVVGTSKSNYAKARYSLMAKLDEIGEKEEYKLHYELN